LSSYFYLFSLFVYLISFITFLKYEKKIIQCHNCKNNIKITLIFIKEELAIVVILKYSRFKVVNLNVHDKYIITHYKYLRILIIITYIVHSKFAFLLLYYLLCSLKLYILVGNHTRCYTIFYQGVKNII
jgi:hypothetical protein